jgi:hypothetical protein
MAGLSSKPIGGERLVHRVAQPTNGQPVVGQDPFISYSTLEETVRPNQCLVRARWCATAAMNCRLRDQGWDERRIDVERFAECFERPRVVAAGLAQCAPQVVWLRPQLCARNGLLAVFLGEV